MSYNNIVPTDLQDELVQLRDQATRNSFRIGDIVLQTIQERPDVQISDIHSAVAMFIGKSSRTIREYAMVSAFYPVRERVKYDLLAFDHFRIAMRFGEKTYDALDWCLLKVDELNRPATVDAMELNFADQLSDENFRDDEEEEKESSNELLDLVRKIKTALTNNAKGIPAFIIREVLELVSKIEADILKLA